MADIDTQFDFVELNRTFHELSDYASDSNEVDLNQAIHVGKSLQWPNLIQERRVVLLSEADSGKTTEIRNISEKLRAEGKAAFFLRLEHIPHDFEDAFEVGDHNKFQKWINSEVQGWMFLDSVDEARLQSPNDFELAIRKMGRQLCAAKDRVHIVISGRTHAWRPKTDLAYCKQHLTFDLPRRVVADQEPSDDTTQPKSIQTAQNKSTRVSSFKLVTLDILSSDQIAIFARARGITNTGKFLHAIERVDAWTFASNPQYIEELVQLWINEQRIGSRLELIENSIVRRLEERDQNRADARPLSAKDALYGVKLLSAAATLGQTQTLRVPDGAENTNGIKVSDVLQDWDDKKRAALLSRPIFDEEIYGTVRFRHRTVRKYLTAKWLFDLFSRETSRRNIEALLFRNQYGVDVVVPTLRPVLPWLAILDDKVREWLIKTAPEVVFEGGDPSQLPLDTQQKILLKVCEQMMHGTSSHTVNDYSAVQRFGNSRLTEDIRRLINQYTENNELIGFLLRMVWLGELKAALPEAKTVALSTSFSTYTRTTAIKTVKAIGTKQDVEDIRQTFLKESTILNRDWMAELITNTELSPDHFPWLFSALSKTAAKKRFGIDRLTVAIEELVQPADLEILPQIVSGLIELMSQSPHFKGLNCEISEKHGWLLTAAAKAVERIIQEQNPAALADDTLEVLRLFQACKRYDFAEIRNGSDLKSLPTISNQVVQQVSRCNVCLLYMKDIRIVYPLDPSPLT